MQLTRFVDPLPIPETLKPDYRKDDITRYTVTMKQVYQSLHRDLPRTKLWGYNGVFPGPKFEVRKGELVDVLWENNLPKEHLLPVDTSIHGAQKSNPLVRTVVHLHGASVQPDNDGHPEAWFTQNFEKTGPSYKHKIYRYTNNQHATMLWYHDHALGITRLNVYAGLAGIYFIRDEKEVALPLPKGPYEIPLVIMDRTVNPDGSLYYPKLPMPSDLKNPKSKIPIPSVIPEFFGKQILVNGKIWPFLNIEPRKYRFRILNASNSRYYNLKLSSEQAFYQIGSDGGLLKKRVKLKELLIAPAERVDVIVDFSKMVGKKIILTNNAAAPFPNGKPENYNPDTTGTVMQFRVNLPLKGKDTSRIPRVLSKIVKFSTRGVKKVRNLSLDETHDQYGRLLQLLTNRMWDDPITEKPVIGTKEIWNLINTTSDTHPIHLHLVQFQILQRRPYDVNYYNKTGELRYTGRPTKPAPNERGFKDTVKASPGEVTKIIARFGPFTGEYVWHCHMLEHEDHDMMRPYIVIPKKRKKD
ncbi:multicopper oxidase [Paenibacillus sp.]|jgi:spore coat protein A|uniref:multicopper oxidase family protein n=1 Tax=Paenibacillus sp. TaxID=58172 RepID=UPI0028303E5E|nr:multicopper oxidase [Paenibacillus sp.]MDR0269491.1 multicopper oxidase domain-containing protein [Paenibacillus sp.]